MKALALLLLFLVSFLVSISEARKLCEGKTGSPKGLSKGTSKGGSKGDGMKLEMKCSVFQVYDNTVRFNRPRGKGGNLPWNESCDEFDPVDSLLCPNDDVVSDICKHKHPELNPSVKFNYCEPLFESMEDEGRKSKCTFYCVNYVSADRGGCCDFLCEDTGAQTP